MTLDETKAYLRLETSGEDALVMRLVESAVALAESYLGIVLVRRTVVETLAPDDTGRWRRLGRAPVAAILEVARIDDGSGSGGGGGGATALAAGAFAVDIDARGEGWVRATGQLRVTYHAGLAEGPGEVPAPIAQGVTRLAAHLYARRDDMSGPPAAVAALWRPYRRIRLGLGTRA